MPKILKDIEHLRENNNYIVVGYYYSQRKLKDTIVVKNGCVNVGSL